MVLYLIVYVVGQGIGKKDDDLVPDACCVFSCGKW